VTSFRPPLVASIVGHAGVLALLALFAAQLPPVPLPQPPKNAIEVMLASPKPAAEMPPPAPEPPPVTETQPPPPEPPPPPAAIPKPEPPPPPPKPVVRKQVVKPPPPPRPQPVREIPPQPVQPPAPRVVQAPPVQTAAIAPVPAPMPRPAPVVSGSYRAALSAWLESHKRYPDSARQRGEEGRAVLRFRVDRSGRVLTYALASSTGYADLDAAIDAMMRGATLPPFPADMTASDVEVSVTVRFSLTR
jgi:protein TonB